MGVPEHEESPDFEARLAELHEEFEVLNVEAHELEEYIVKNVLGSWAWFKLD